MQTDARLDQAVGDEQARGPPRPARARDERAGEAPEERVAEREPPRKRPSTAAVASLCEPSKVARYFSKHTS
jgi:hypothetical protein